jgi:hypothetical protein
LNSVRYAALLMLPDLPEVEAVLLPALTSAFEELAERGLGDYNISVARRFIEER